MHVAFSGSLVVERVNEGTWKLAEDLRLWVAPAITFYDGTTVNFITVPRGFKTDFASVPRIPLAYLVAGGLGDRAAVVHDYFCVTKKVPYTVAADIFDACLKKDGINWFKRTLMVRAVRWFGPRF